MFLDRHLYRGRLNYLLFGRQVEKVKSWLHRKTAPPAPASEQPPEQEADIVEDVAPHRSYQYVPPEPEPQESQEVPDAAPEPEQRPEQEPPPASTAEPEQPEPLKPETPADAPPAAPEPAPSSEGDEYSEDDEYLRHMASVEVGPQPGAVDAEDLLVLLSVFSKKQSATEQEIATARRAMRAVSGSEIERAILDQLNGKDGYIAVMLDMITKDLHAADDAPPQMNTSSDPAFRLADYVPNV